MTAYMVPNVAAGLLVGNHNPGLSYRVVHDPECRFMPDSGLVLLADLVAEQGEDRVRRDIRVHRITACHFCQPKPLTEGKPPHLRHAEALAENETPCGCGHRYVSHALGGGACYVGLLDDWDTPRRCECTEFVAAITVTTEPLRSPNPDDAIEPGAFTPGPVPVRLSDGETITGEIDADGRLTVTFPSHHLMRSDETHVLSIGPIVIAP